MDNLPVILVRFALYADLMVLTGTIAFSLYALTSEERAANILPSTKLAFVLSFLGLLLSGFGMLTLVAAMTGSSLWTVDREVLRGVIGQSAIGTAWIVRMVAMAVAAAASLAINRSTLTPRLALLASSAIAIATLVWTGHAGATEGWIGNVHRLSDMVHMLAAAVWIGAIAAFSWMLFRPGDRRSISYVAAVHRALEQFSRVGTLAVGSIIATGVINSLILMGLPSPFRLFASFYGQLLLAKLGLFGAMLLLAAANRWQLTPALGVAIGSGDSARAVRNLKMSLTFECAAALAILALVGWLGTLEPLEATL